MKVTPETKTRVLTLTDHLYIYNEKKYLYDKFNEEYVTSVELI